MADGTFDINEHNDKLVDLIDFLGLEDDLRELGYSKEHFTRILTLCNEKMMQPKGSVSDKIAWLNMISQKSIEDKKGNIPSVPESLFLIYSRMINYIDKKSCPEFGKFKHHDQSVVHKAGERLKNVIESAALNKNPEGI
jgi:hypothetical protein